MNNKIPVIIADDHSLIRQGIKLLVNETEKFEVVADAANGEELIEKATALERKPQLALIDISMPVMDGYETISRLNECLPDLKCIALSVYNDFNTVFRIIRCGAKAYLQKDCSPDVLEATMLNVSQAGFYYSSFVVDSLTEYHKTNPDVSSAYGNTPDKLSEREMQFINLCCSELVYKEIADKMNVSPRTVDGYREEVFSKLNLKSRIGIVLYAIRNGLYHLDNPIPVRH